MEMGGLMAHTFKIFIGDRDIMVVALTMMVFSTLMLIALNLLDRSDRKE